MRYLNVWQHQFNNDTQRGKISFIHTPLFRLNTKSLTMFTDTKNVESFYCSQCNLAELAMQNTKKRGKLKKLLKPLLKIIAGNGCNSSSSNKKPVHLNNVNLNNSKDKSLVNAEVVKSCNESKNIALSTSFVKDKVADGLRSKPFVEYFQSKYCQENFASFEDFQKYGKEVYVPVKYILTEDGTFFWTQTLQKVDDDLVAAAVSKNSNNSPIEKTVWDKTTLSLMY